MITVYSKRTGAPVLVPKAWMDVPHLASRFTTTKPTERDKIEPPKREALSEPAKRGKTKPEKEG